MAKLIIKIVSRFIPTGTIFPILKGPLKGYKWIAGSTPGNGKGLSVLFNKSEQQQLHAAISLTKKDAICFDIGAHVGLYTLAFSKFSKHVFAFEPLPSNIAYLSSHCSINKLKNVTIVPFAISANTGMSLFSEGNHSSEGKLENSGTIPVFSVKLDDYISKYNNKPDIIKIDVEGSEMDLLEGGAHYLQMRKPVLLLSTHSELLRENCLNLLKKYGYHTFKGLNGKDLFHSSEFAIY